MKKYLFKDATISIIVKAENEFMAACYANQYLETRWLLRFETNDAIELDNDMDFGVIAVIMGGHGLEFFDSENLFYTDKLRTPNQQHEPKKEISNNE